MEISKIVITGGPCAGKTTAMSWIQNAFTKKGYTVLFIGETATEFIRGGVAPWTCGTNVEYQKCQMKLQIEKEKLFEQAAKTMNTDKVLLVCDRGALDNRAYMTNKEFQEVLDYVHSNEIELRDSYDAVFHLVSAAKGAEQFYTTANNEARTETVEEARDLDDKLIASWTGHPHFRIINNETDFGEKMRRLLMEISLILGEPAPYLTKRRFLIEYPNIEHLRSLPNCERVDIIQTYLKSPNGREVRIRQRGKDGHYIYFQKMQRDPSGTENIQIERRLDKDEYLRMLMDADTSMKQLRKTRYCIAYGIQYAEVDVFPFWNDKAMLSICIRDENEPLIIPKDFKVIKETTEDPDYTNLALASRF